MKSLTSRPSSDLAAHFPPEPPREGEVDLRSLFGTVFDHKRFLTIGIAAIFLASVAYVLMATPRYQASSLIKIERGAPSVPGQAPTGSSTESARGSQAATEIPLLTSRTLFADAVRDLNLDVVATPQRFPLLGEYLARRFQPKRAGDVASPWLGLERYGWGGERLLVERMDVPATLQDQPLLLVAGAQGRYTLFDDDGNELVQGRVGAPASGNGINMQVTELRANPGTHFDVLRRSPLAAVTDLAANVEASERGRDSGIISVTYENRDPEQAARVLDHITSAYVRQNVERNSAEAEKSLQFVNKQLPKVRAELARAQAELNEFQSQSHTIDIGSQNQALLNQTVAINASLQQLRTQQPEIARRFTSAHPAAKALQQQIAQLEGEKAALQARMSRLPDIQEGLFRLNQNVEVTNRTYTNLLDQAQRLDIARASAIGNVHVIDRPRADLAMLVWPRPLLIIVGATALGSLLLVGFVLVRQAFRSGVEDASDIERLGLPVYASILRSPQARALTVGSRGRFRELRPRLLALDAPSDLAMEALRSLRTSLHFARIEPENNVLMIAGPNFGVGKTFVSSNLGVVVAQAGQRVLVIDADMRRGTLHEVLGARPEDGLSELLRGEIELEEAIRQMRGADNFSFISRGRLPSNPSELLMHPRFAELLRTLRPQYDLIIIDTPPVLAVTDAAVIGQHVGTTLIVARFGVDQAREVALARQRLEQSGVTVEGAIVNAVDPRSAGPYVYSYYGPGAQAA